MQNINVPTIFLPTAFQIINKNSRCNNTPKGYKIFSEFCNHLLHRKITFLVLFHLTHLLLNSSDMWLLKLYCTAMYNLAYGKKNVLFCYQCKYIKHQKILQIQVLYTDEICTSWQFHGFLQWAIFKTTSRVYMSFMWRSCCLVWHEQKLNSPNNLQCRISNTTFH